MSTAACATDLIPAVEPPTNRVELCTLYSCKYSELFDAFLYTYPASVFEVAMKSARNSWLRFPTASTLAVRALIKDKTSCSNKDMPNQQRRDSTIHFTRRADELVQTLRSGTKQVGVDFFRKSGVFLQA